MIPEIALFSLILTTVFSLSGCILPVIKKYQFTAWMLSYGTFISTTSAILLLAYSFSVDNFSVLYVAQHSNSHLPLFFKIAAVWGGHEGSLLFWVFALSTWSASIAFANRKHHQDYISRVLIVMNFLVFSFALMTLLASNPFERIFPMPLEGRDLNPMLQDIGLIFHPPLLYMGYVGFSAAFAFAVAALTLPDMNVQWTKWSQSWTITAWVMLTAGIALGAWWAYYELGWGGWWFWDPVENASLLPWLTGTALLHVLIASQKRNALIKWSILLSIFTFCLSILGTFVVRSGVLTSVHAFAVDPTRGILLLVILAVCLVIPLTLFAMQAVKLPHLQLNSIISREVLFLIVASLFSIATLTVLIGTFYPMLFQAFDLGSISVGAPYFNSTFVPLVLLALILMIISPFVQWKKSKRPQLLKQITPALFALILTIILYSQFTPMDSIFVFCVLLLCSLLIVITLKQCDSRHKLPMVIAHWGVAIIAIGALMNSYYSTEVTKKMGPQDQVTLQNTRYIYQETQWIIGPNYTAEQAVINMLPLNKIAERSENIIIPQRRHYQVRVMNMSEPAIYSQLFYDVYITMGEKINATQYAIRIQHRAFTIWLWIGALLLIIGGTTAVINRIKRH